MSEDSFLSEFDGIDEFKDIVRKSFDETNENVYFSVIGHNQLDLIGEKIPDEELFALSDEICKYGLPLNKEHDLRIPPFGKVIKSTILAKRHDPTYLILFGAIKIFNKNDYLPLPIIDNYLVPKNLLLHDFYNGNIQIGYSTNEIDHLLISESINELDKEFNIKTFREERRSKDPLIILSFVLPAYLLYPAIKKYAEKLGESAFEKQSKFISWVRNSIYKKINRKVLYKFSSPYKNCDISFMIQTNDLELLTSAIQDIENASTKAIFLVDKIVHKNPSHLVYLYDHEKTKQWIPEYIKTIDNKVFTDKPYLLSLEELKINSSLSLGTTYFD